MNAEKFLEIINAAGINYFAGVPDSQLSAFTDAVVTKYGFDERYHTIAVNEGCAVGMAAGYHLATGQAACVYMQNSGLGNAVNPVTSLLNPEVYSIGCLFVIGWRGEPGTADEPQHVFMGKSTLPLLDLLGVKYLVIDKNTSCGEFETEFKRLSELLQKGESVAVVVSKNALDTDSKPVYANDYSLCRERIIEEIAGLTGEDDVIVSTTGKISRELYEVRKKQGKAPGQDFLTVGSMGHCSSIALGIAVNKKDKRVIVLDGDGAALMHMGALTTVGRLAPRNLVHILLDNSAHETVGGMPTGCEKVDFCEIAKNSGYREAVDAGAEESYDEVKAMLKKMLAKPDGGPVFIRIPVALGSRADLGRPKEKAAENKTAFMKNLSKG